MICLYDGTFAGLLCVLYRLFKRREQPTNITATLPPTADLFAAPLETPTDPDKAQKLLEAIREHLSPHSHRHILHAFLSECDGVEMDIYRYLALGWKVRRQLDSHLGHEAVDTVHKRARRVTSEAHRLKGLVRFSETEDGLFYAPIEPDANVLPLMASHFFARHTDCAWLLHDVRRGLGALCDGTQWTLGEVNLNAPPQLSAEEKEWQTLWRTFFHHISIPERRNPKLQQSFMPMKYWKYLVEMNPAD